MKKSISFKLALIMLCVILIGVIIIVGGNIAITGNILIQESLDKIYSETVSEVRKMDGWLTKNTVYLSAIACDLGKGQNISDAELVKLFNSHLENMPEYFDLYLGRPDGTAVFASEWEPDDGWIPYERDWYKGAAANQKETYITSPYVDAMTNELCISIAGAVVFDGKLAGVVSNDMYVTVLSDIVSSASIGEGSYAFLTDAEGGILIHPNIKYGPIDDETFQNLADIENGTYFNLWKQVKDSDEIIKYRDSSGKMKYYTASTLESTGWKLITVLPAGVVTKPITTLIFIVIPVTFVILAVAAALILREINVVVTKPLNIIINKLTDSSKTISVSAGQFAETSENLAVGSSKQAASIEETSATMNETSSMISQNAENTKIASQIADESVQVVDKTEKYMTELMNIMGELKESSDKVGKIVKTIDDIAFQTNLLAINATVEAARAGGDAGRSFAVVAQEVRSLAQRSADASHETSEIINRNIKLTETSRTSVEQVLELTQKNSEQTEKLGKLINEINSASEEQASGIKQINIAVSQMEKVTQENAAAAEENAASSNDIHDEILNLEDAVEIVKNLVGTKN